MNTEEKPNQLPTPNFDRLKELCQEYVDFVDDDTQYNEDNDYYDHIAEAAITAIYGDKIWDFINNRQP